MKIKFKTSRGKIRASSRNLKCPKKSIFPQKTRVFPPDSTDDKKPDIEKIIGGITIIVIQNELYNRERQLFRIIRENYAHHRNSKDCRCEGCQCVYILKLLRKLAREQ